MNRRQIDEVRNGARAKIRQVRQENKGNDSLVLVIDRQESIPRALLLDRSVSAGAVRAYGILLTHAPTIFPGMRSLGKFLGGQDGAVRTTDELFLSGWITKEVVREAGKQQSLGTIYVCFPRRMEPSEMAALDCGWVPFVSRLAQPAKSKNDKKAALRRRANAVIESNQELFGGVFPISDSEISDSENATRSFLQGEVFSTNKFSSKKTPIIEFGFPWPAAWARYLDEKSALVIMKNYKVTDTAMARRVLAEWSASVEENSRWGQLADPTACLIGLCMAAAEKQSVAG